MDRNPIIATLAVLPVDCSGFCDHIGAIDNRSRSTNALGDHMRLSLSIGFGYPAHAMVAVPSRLMDEFDQRFSQRNWSALQRLTARALSRYRLGSAQRAFLLDAAMNVFRAYSTGGVLEAGHGRRIALQFLRRMEDLMKETRQIRHELDGGQELMLVAALVRASMCGLACVDTRGGDDILEQVWHAVYREVCAAGEHRAYRTIQEIMCLLGEHVKRDCFGCLFLWLGKTVDMHDERNALVHAELARLCGIRRETFSRKSSEGRWLVTMCVARMI